MKRLYYINSGEEVKEGDLVAHVTAKDREGRDREFYVQQIYPPTSLIPTGLVWVKWREKDMQPAAPVEFGMEWKEDVAADRVVNVVNVTGLKTEPRIVTVIIRGGMAVSLSDQAEENHLLRQFFKHWFTSGTIHVEDDRGALLTKMLPVGK